MPNINLDLVVGFHGRPSCVELKNALVQNVTPDAHTRINESVGQDPEHKVAILRLGEHMVGLGSVE